MWKTGLPVLILLSALGSGLMAGTFFAFSSFVMRALTRLPPERGAAAMQSVNVAVFPSAFLSVFLGTAALCLGLGIIACLQWGRPGTGWLLAGCLLYLAGTFAVTAAGNVPLNEALAGADPDTPAGAEAWARYVGPWTAWNHVRTAAALAATVAFVLALLANERGGGTHAAPRPRPADSAATGR